MTHLRHMQPKKKILVIDNDAYVQGNIRELLEIKGYEVLTETHVLKGLSQAKQVKPAIILCELVFTETESGELAEKTRNIAVATGFSVIFLVSALHEQKAQLLLHSFNEEYIVKPFTANELLVTVNRKVRENKSNGTNLSSVRLIPDTTVYSTYYHELNTPMHGIIGGLNLLTNSDKNFSTKQMKEMQVSILKSAVRLNHSLSNLMLYEEVKRVEIQPELESLFASNFCEKEWAEKVSEELYAMAAEIYNRKQDIYIEFREAKALEISYEYLVKVLREVTDNALKFSVSGKKIQITGRVEHEYYHIDINDEGSGFVNDQLSEIGPFKQFNRKKTEQQGLGIGLYLAQKLVEFNKGSLFIESSAKTGTRVNITLPIHPN